jgi:hypothetical protein
VPVRTVLLRQVAAVALAARRRKQLAGRRAGGAAQAARASAAAVGRELGGCSCGTGQRAAMWRRLRPRRLRQAVHGDGGCGTGTGTATSGSTAGRTIVSLAAQGGASSGWC